MRLASLDSVTDKSPDAVRILIAEHHPLFRDGLRMLLEAEKSYRVVGGTGDAMEAVKLALQLKPDILLYDLALPYQLGFEALRELARSSAQVRVIIMAATVEKDQILEALHLGARGVLLKESTTQLLHKSIRTVMSGRYWLGRESVSDVVGALRSFQRAPERETGRKKFGLTPRELETVAAVVAGYTNRDIAKKFSLSEQTVKHHLTNIFDKLGVYSRLELAIFAVNHRLLDSFQQDAPKSETQ